MPDVAIPDPLPATVVCPGRHGADGVARNYERRPQTYACMRGMLERGGVVSFNVSAVRRAPHKGYHLGELERTSKRFVKGVRESVRERELGLLCVWHGAVCMLGTLSMCMLGTLSMCSHLSVPRALLRTRTTLGEPAGAKVAPCR